MNLVISLWGKKDSLDGTFCFEIFDLNFKFVTIFDIFKVWKLKLLFNQVVIPSSSLAFTQAPTCVHMMPLNSLFKTLESETK